MAEPILLKLPKPDPREALARRLEDAPVEHAEALVSVLEIIQLLHDKGLLEIAKGALASGDKLIQIAAETAETPEAIRGIRNLIILSKLASSIDPKLLETLAGTLPDAMKEAQESKPPGFFKLISGLGSANMRRLLGVGTRVAESMGKGLGEKSES